MEVLKNINTDKILFLDIETASQYPAYEDMPDTFRKLWDQKAKRIQSESETPAEVLKAFYGDDEKKILSDFLLLLHKQLNSESYFLCAHNGKEFDFPFLARRILLNGLQIPHLLDNAGKKPWEVRHLDTMELWKFGDYKSYTSLNLLAEIFGIPSPKGDMDGTMMHKVYWEDKNWDRIVKYNHRDVLTVAQVYLRFKGEKLIEEQDVVVV